MTSNLLENPSVIEIARQAYRYGEMSMKGKVILFKTVRVREQRLLYVEIVKNLYKLLVGLEEPDRYTAVDLMTVERRADLLWNAAYSNDDVQPIIDCMMKKNFAEPLVHLNHYPREALLTKIKRQQRSGIFEKMAELEIFAREQSDRRKDFFVTKQFIDTIPEELQICSSKNCLMKYRGGGYKHGGYKDGDVIRLGTCGRHSFHEQCNKRLEDCEPLDH
jgi:hypothetical protein